MIELIDAYDRGVNIRVQLSHPSDWIAQASMGAKVRISVISVNAHFSAPPAEDALVNLYARGYQIKADGAVGNRIRDLIPVAPDAVPEEIRVAIIRAAQGKFQERSL